MPNNIIISSEGTGTIELWSTNKNIWQEAKITAPRPETPPNEAPLPNICNICYQDSAQYKVYFGHPQYAKDVTQAFDTPVQLPTGNLKVALNGFSIFDKASHLCPLELMDKEVPLYISGYLEPADGEVYPVEYFDDENPDVFHPVYDLRALTMWVFRFNRNFSWYEVDVFTDNCNYTLKSPEQDYATVYKDSLQKLLISAFVELYYETDSNKRNSLSKMQREIMRSNVNINLLNDDVVVINLVSLREHARFICDRITRASDYTALRELMRQCGIEFEEKSEDVPELKNIKKALSAAETTIPRLGNYMQSLFPHTWKDNPISTSKRCFMCATCQMPDCGMCGVCRAMPKFGGAGTSNRTCLKRKCLNRPPTDDDSSEEGKLEESEPSPSVGSNYRKPEFVRVTWPTDPVYIGDTRISYDTVKVNDMRLKVGDFILLEPRFSTVPVLVCRIAYIWSIINEPEEGYMHCEMFFRSADTVLGELGYARELFLSDNCCDSLPVSGVLGKANVKFRKPTGESATTIRKPENLPDDGITYYYYQHYERFTGRFEDIPEDPPAPIAQQEHRYCGSCKRKDIQDLQVIPRLRQVPIKGRRVHKQNIEMNKIEMDGQTYQKNMGVFLKPGTFLFRNLLKRDKKRGGKVAKVDANMYPESFSKSDKNIQGSNNKTRRPFDVGLILAIFDRSFDLIVAPGDIYMKVQVLYRPHQTAARFPQNEDLNVVYWTDEVRIVSAMNLRGLCQLYYKPNIPRPEPMHAAWLEEDPDRFYFQKAYDKTTKKFSRVPPEAKCVGLGNPSVLLGTSKEKETNRKAAVEPPLRPLRTLDVFAGCGGLSEGLRLAGVAQCRWAIDNDAEALRAYATNHPDCTAYNEDCNKLLGAVLAGRKRSANGQRLPAKGDVELLCAGPPCQGFSGLNRFSSNEPSAIKNSLIATTLAYCAYYKPNYMVFENVMTLALFKKGIALKVFIRALLDMGYQCVFGVLQAGNFGVPQSRRRLIVYAAAPGYKLPNYPEASHVFSKSGCSLSLTIDEKTFTTNARWFRFAPRRTCTAYDAISDLPPITSGCGELEMPYDASPQTHFQRMMRDNQSSVLTDHICKKVTPLVQARMDRIPTAPGSDWRNLPNISVTLSNGTKTEVLKYNYPGPGRRVSKRKRKTTKSRTRGVCPCASGRPCQATAQQKNTLIPWSLAHTADLHSNWAGLYGRVAWDGYLSTTLTDPHPMHTQGRVLHPEQARVLSVRECARSQGFGDHYRFSGTIRTKYRQIGNAVPPPLARALGRELKKAMEANEWKKNQNLS